MPQSFYMENPDDATKRAKPNLDGSLNVVVGNFPSTQNVSVSNFPATQTVAGTVSVSNFPSTQVVKEAAPASSDIVRGSLDATGTLVTIPAGRTFKGSVSISACVAVAGTSQPSISIAAGTIHKVTLNGLALSSISTANTINDVYIFGGASGTAVTFTQGAAGTSTGQIAGILL